LGRIDGDFLEQRRKERTCVDVTHVCFNGCHGFHRTYLDKPSFIHTSFNIPQTHLHVCFSISQSFLHIYSRKRSFLCFLLNSRMLSNSRDLKDEISSEKLKPLNDFFRNTRESYQKSSSHCNFLSLQHSYCRRLSCFHPTFNNFSHFQSRSHLKYSASFFIDTSKEIQSGHSALSLSNRPRTSKSSACPGDKPHFISVRFLDFH
jgi:hypothetical protein